MRLTDRQTDGRTDKILIARPCLHSMQRSKNQKKNCEHSLVKDQGWQSGPRSKTAVSHRPVKHLTVSAYEDRPVQNKHVTTNTYVHENANNHLNQRHTDSWSYNRHTHNHFMYNHCIDLLHLANSSSKVSREIVWSGLVPLLRPNQTVPPSKHVTQFLETRLQ